MTDFPLCRFGIERNAHCFFVYFFSEWLEGKSSSQIMDCWILILCQIVKDLFTSLSYGMGPVRTISSTVLLKIVELRNYIFNANHIKHAYLYK